MADNNKSISQLDELSSVSEDDLMIVSHLSSDGWQSMSAKAGSLSSMYSSRDDVVQIVSQLHEINFGDNI